VILNRRKGESIGLRIVGGEDKVRGKEEIKILFVVKE
jgi:hypothetical protein